MDLRFEGVSFNIEHNSSLTEKQFIDQALAGKKGLYSREKKETRIKLLKEAYRLIKSNGGGNPAAS